MNGWTDGWMDGWTDGQTKVQEGRVDRWMNIYEWMDRRNEWMDGRADRRTDGLMNEQTEIQTNRQANRHRE